MNEINPVFNIEEIFYQKTIDVMCDVKSYTLSLLCLSFTSLTVTKSAKAFLVRRHHQHSERRIRT